MCECVSVCCVLCAVCVPCAGANLSPLRQRAMTFAMIPEAQNLCLASAQSSLADASSLRVGDPLDETLGTGGRDGLSFLVLWSEYPPAHRR